MSQQKCHDVTLNFGVANCTEENSRKAAAKLRMQMEAVLIYGPALFRLWVEKVPEGKRPGSLFEEIR